MYKNFCSLRTPNTTTQESTSSVSYRWWKSLISFSLELVEARMWWLRVPDKAVTATKFTDIVTVVIMYLKRRGMCEGLYLKKEPKRTTMAVKRENYTILRPLWIALLFFVASLSISSASESRLWYVEERKIEVDLLPPFAAKVVLMSFIAEVVLYTVPTASSAVSMRMSTTVFALEWNFAFPPRTTPVPVLH